MTHALNVEARYLTKIAASWFDISGRKKASLPNWKLTSNLELSKFKSSSILLCLTIQSLRVPALFLNSKRALSESAVLTISPLHFSLLMNTCQVLTLFSFNFFFFSGKCLFSIHWLFPRTWYVFLVSASMAFLFGSFTRCCVFDHTGWVGPTSRLHFAHLIWQIDQFRGSVKGGTNVPRWCVLHGCHLSGHFSSFHILCPYFLNQHLPPLPQTCTNDLTFRSYNCASVSEVSHTARLLAKVLTSFYCCLHIVCHILRHFMTISKTNRYTYTHMYTHRGAE